MAEPGAPRRAPAGAPAREKLVPWSPAPAPWLRALQLGGLAALALLAALAHGGIPAAVRAALVCGALALALAEWLQRAWRGALPDPFERAWLPLWLVATALVALQLAPLPLALAGRLGAVPAALRELSDVRAPRISAMPGETASYWASFSAYWLLCLAAARLPRRELRVLALGAVALAAFESAYGVAALFAGSDSVLGIWPRGAHRADATGSFANRNHYAGLLALLWPFGLARILELEQPRLRALRPALALLFSLLVGGALCASHSRAGLVSAGLGLAAWRLADRGGSPANAATALPRALYWGPAALGLALAALLGGELAVDRFGELVSNTDRFQVWRSALALPQAVWWLGAGAGAFPDVFKLVHPGALRGSYPQAHCEYLELVVGFGGLGAAALAACALRWWRAVAPLRSAGLAAGALGGVVAVALHVLVDFDLQRPGVAVPFWILLGVAVNPAAQPLSAGEAASARGRRRRG